MTGFLITWSTISQRQPRIHVVCTASGLNRYDGYNVKIFQNVPGDTSSLLVNDITRLFEGPDGKIWLYTHSENNVYNPKTEIFHRNTNVLLKKIGVAEGLITFIHKDRKGNFWFIHYNQGLFRYNPADKTTIRFQSQSGDESTISSASMSVVQDDANGNLWILHNNGVFEKDGKRSKKTAWL